MRIAPTKSGAFPLKLADFTKSESVGGYLLLACTVVALIIANTGAGPAWLAAWQAPLGPLTMQHWVNDGVMAVFFLLIGLELERELYAGELSELRVALLPVVAAVGGVVAPALVHFAINANTPAQPGAGIPMATDIAFALAALRTLGTRIPTALTVFLTALAVIDDLIAIVVIGVAYSTTLSAPHVMGAVLVLGIMVAMNRLNVFAVLPYLVAGALLWTLLLASGLHATLAGIATAFAIPFRRSASGGTSPSAALESRLHRPVALVVLPMFALANAGVSLQGVQAALVEPNSLGILFGLVAGKPFGIALACLLAGAVGIVRPPALRWPLLIGAGMLAGIGFTMSIFVANLAFPDRPDLVSHSKLAIMVGSACSAALGMAWLFVATRARGSRSPG